MTNVFKGFTKLEKRKLLKDLEAEKLTFGRNTSLLERIDKSNLIGVLESGCAQIIRTDYDGNIIIIEDLKVGSLFGIRFSLINNDEFDIVTKEESDFIFIDYDMIKIDFRRSNYYQKFSKIST